MIGFLFMFILFMTACVSKWKVDTSDHQIQKKLKDDPTAKELGVFTSSNGLVDMYTHHPVMLWSDNNGHMIRKDLKTGYERDITNERNIADDAAKVQKALSDAKGNDFRFVHYGYWTKRFTLLNGVYGDIYIDKKNPNKRYVCRYFSVNPKISMDRDFHIGKALYHYGGIKNNVVYFSCLMDIETGKIIGLTEECKKSLDNKYATRLDTHERCMELITDFIKFFNQAQENGGFYNIIHRNHNVTCSYKSEIEKFYCTDPMYS